MNIYEKMLKVTEEIAVVGKNLMVETGKGKGYKAVSEADVLAAVKPIEIKYGIYSYPHNRQIVESGEITTENQYGKMTRLYMRVETTYRFINVENPDEYIDIVTYGDGVDSQDKAPGKAMTYGDKYALLKAYKIQTGDDPDAAASETYVGKNTQDAMKQPVTEKELETLKNLFAKAGYDPVNTFPHFPNITREEAGRAMTELRKRMGA